MKITRSEGQDKNVPPDTTVLTVQLNGGMKFPRQFYGKCVCGGGGYDVWAGGMPSPFARM